MSSFEPSHQFTDDAGEKKLIGSYVPGKVLGTVELSGGLKEISVFHDVFLRYAFHDSSEYTLSIFREFVNIYINAARSMIGEENISIRDIPERYHLNAQWQHLTWEEDKQTDRYNDLRADAGDNSTYIEFQNSLRSVKQKDRPDLTIEDRTLSYFALGINSNTYQKTTDLIWFFTKSKTDDKALASRGFTSFSLRRDHEPYDKLAVTSPSTVLWVDLPALMQLDGHWDGIESIRLARQLTKILYGEEVEDKENIILQIEEFLEMQFYSFQNEQGVLDVLTRNEIHDSEIREQGREQGKEQEKITIAKKLLRRGLSREEICEITELSQSEVLILQREM
ncbi:MAG: hypothetical protein LBR74_01220 [Eubacterium sp.]|jgi:hypothetical protein|nr:hypothetical protein [Eubacterium sp.]